MDLNEAQKALVPGVEAILTQGKSYRVAKLDLAITMVHVALAKSGQDQSVAARKLGVTRAWINQMRNGTSSIFHSKRTKAERKASEQE